MTRVMSVARLTLAALALAAMAACGGGGDDDNGGGAQTPAVSVASLVFPSSDAIAIVGTRRVLPVTVKGSDGSTLTDRTVSWDSSNTAVGTVEPVGQPGAVTGQAAGTTMVGATAEGKSASVKVEVKNPPADLAAFKALFPFASVDGQFVVASEIDDGFDVAQLAQLKKAWNFFVDFFPQSPGSYTELYYTWEAADDTATVPALLAYAKANFPECASSIAKLPGRTLLTCSEPTHLTWIVAPYVDPADGTIPADAATNLASIGQSFMDAISTVPTYAWPWLWEGLSYAFKSGSFDAAGQYTMGPLADPEASTFQQSLANGTVLTLAELIALTRDRATATGTWYQQASVRAVEAQSAVLLSYLYRNHAPVLKSLFVAIDSGTITTSQQAFDKVLADTAMTAEELDAAYKAYASTL